MEILSLPIGVVIGLFPVLVDLGPQEAPAELRLDGRTVCSVTKHSPSCVVDFGVRPRLHQLEAIRRDAKGLIVERTVRWVNRPGIRAELHASCSCRESEHACSIQLTWGHPAKLDPVQVFVSLDGHRTKVSATPKVVLPFPNRNAPEVLFAEAQFSDGARASLTRLLRGSYPADAEVSLQPICVDVDELSSGEKGVLQVAGGGGPVQAVDLGEEAVTFVVEPHSLDSVRDLEKFTLRPEKRIASPLETVDRIRITVGNEVLAASDLRGPIQDRARWLRSLIFTARDTKYRYLRLADAVAATGYALAARPQRRVLVLVLSELGDRLGDDSVFAPADVVSYLREIRVPLVVWRSGTALGAGWPAGSHLVDARDFASLAKTVRARLELQRIAWVDGRIDPWTSSPARPEGGAKVLSSHGPAHITGLAPAGHGRPRRIFAASLEGLWCSAASSTWLPVPLTQARAPVASVTATGAGVVIGSATGVTTLLPDHNQTTPMPDVLAVEHLSETDVVSLSRDGVRQSADCGETWSDAATLPDGALGISIAADPDLLGIVYVGTQGSGVYRSLDGGRTWVELGRVLRRTVVRALAIEHSCYDAVYVAGDNGVLVGDDFGDWHPMNTGLPRTIVYSLLIDSNDPNRPMYAGTAEGVFVTTDRSRWSYLGGHGWPPVTSLLVCPGSGKLVAGTFGEGLTEIPLPTR